MSRCKPKEVSTCSYRFIHRSEYVENGIDPDYTGISLWKCTNCGHITKSM